MGKKGQAAGAFPRPRSLTSRLLTLVLVLMLAAGAARGAELGSDVSLDGTWDFGMDHAYNGTVHVPGLGADPTLPTPKTPWFRRVVQFPGGAWTTAILRFRGARGTPGVSLQGQAVPVADDGAGAWHAVLPANLAAPGAVVVLEVSLKPPAPPASVPSSTDVSADLWDDVDVHLSGAAWIEALSSQCDWPTRTLALRWTCGGATTGAKVAAQIWDGATLVAESPPAPADAGAARIAVPAGCVPWSPAHPRVYRLRVALRTAQGLVDSLDEPWIWRDLRMAGGHWELNGRALELRGVQVAWHEWLCDPESAELAFDAGWFERAVIQPLRAYGANFILFCGERPPRRLLDLCDRDGVVAQVGAAPGTVDGFGGIFLDGEGRPSESASVRAQIIRYLGPRQSSVQRLVLQARLCAHVAEAARLRGAAAIAPLCVLSSPPARYHGYIGHLADAVRKPVWDALAAANAPLTAILDFWDSDFAPGATVRVPVVFLNDTARDRTVSADVALRAAADGGLASQAVVRAHVPAGGRTAVTATLTLPALAGEWMLSSTLRAAGGSGPPAISFRPVRTVAPSPSAPLAGRTVGVPADEPELWSMLQRDGFHVVDLKDVDSGLVLLGRKAWDRVVAGGPEAMAPWSNALAAGRSIVWLDVGRPPGSAGGVVRVSLPSGVTAAFRPSGVAESFIHPSPEGGGLWYQLPYDAGWRWNGGQAGTIVPEELMEVTGLTARAVFGLWTRRGAQGYQVMRGPGYAYELQGQYAFSSQPDDAGAVADLRARLRDIAHDQPVLNSILNFNAPVRQFDMTAAYHAAGRVGARSIVPLVVAGADLARTPVVEIGYGAGKGVLILSQLETAGRLAPSAHYDPAAEQMVLNMLGLALDAYVPPPP